MSKYITLLVYVVLAGVALWLYYQRTKPAPPVVVTPPAWEIVPNVPILPSPTVAVADTSGRTHAVAVERPRDVEATVTVAADTVNTVLLIDRVRPTFLSELWLRRDVPSVRRVGPGPPVVVVPQRLPFLDLERSVFGIVGLDSSGLSAGVGASFVRAWFLHAGVGATIDGESRLQLHLNVRARIYRSVGVGFTTSKQVLVTFEL